MSKMCKMPEMSLNKYSGYGLAALRVFAAYMFLLHGTAKFWGFPVGNGGTQLFSLFGVAGALEIVGGALLILGLFTRPVAFLLSGMMAVAYFYLHFPSGNGLLPLANGGELAVLYCFIFLSFVFTGPGAFALDNKKA